MSNIMYQLNIVRRYSSGISKLAAYISKRFHPQGALPPTPPRALSLDPTRGTAPRPAPDELVMNVSVLVPFSLATDPCVYCSSEITMIPYSKQLLS